MSGWKKLAIASLLGGVGGGLAAGLIVAFVMSVPLLGDEKWQAIAAIGTLCAVVVALAAPWINEWVRHYVAKKSAISYVSGSLFPEIQRMLENIKKVESSNRLTINKSKDLMEIELDWISQVDLNLASLFEGGLPNKILVINRRIRDILITINDHAPDLSGVDFFRLQRQCISLREVADSCIKLIESKK